MWSLSGRGSCCAAIDAGNSGDAAARPARLAMAFRRDMLRDPRALLSTCFLLAVHSDHGTIDRLQRRSATLTHVTRELGLQHFHDALDAVGAVRRKAPHDGPPDQHALGA